MLEAGQAAGAGHQRQRLGHQVEVRQPLRLPRIARRRHQARHRRDGRRQGRGRLRLRRRRQGLRRIRCAASARASSSPRSIRSTPCRPRWKASKSPRRRHARPRRHLRHHAPATATSSRSSTCSKMKDQAIVCNIGHFDNEIQVDRAERRQGRASASTSSRRSTSTPSPNGNAIFLLAEGRLVNLGCATGHPSFVMSNSFSNQTLAQLDLWTEQGHVQSRRLSPAEEARRRSRAPAPRKDRREAHQAHARSRPTTSACRSKARTSRSTTATERKQLLRTERRAAPAALPARKDAASGADQFRILSAEDRRAARAA